MKSTRVQYGFCYGLWLHQVSLEERAVPLAIIATQKATRCWLTVGNPEHVLCMETGKRPEEITGGQRWTWHLNQTWLRFQCVPKCYIQLIDQQENEELILRVCIESRWAFQECGLRTKSPRTWIKKWIGYPGVKAPYQRLPWCHAPHNAVPKRCEDVIL